MLTLEDIIKKTPDLPTMPAAALAVIREAESATASAQSVARFLEQDQALTTRVLRLANSTYYSFARTVMSPQDAVIVLGMRCTRSLAVVASTYPWMIRPLKGYCLGPQDLWSHSFGTAVGAQLVAEKTGCVEPDIAFTAGLIHNIGKTALSIWLENKLVGLNNIADKAGLTFDGIERKLLGYDHADVGAHLAREWGLPERYVAGIQFHHRPNDATKEDPLIDCVHIGDYLAMSMGLGLSGEGLRYTLEESALTRVNLSSDELDELVLQFIVSYNEHEKLFEDRLAA